MLVFLSLTSFVLTGVMCTELRDGLIMIGEANELDQGKVKKATTFTGSGRVKTLAISFRQSLMRKDTLNILDFPDIPLPIK